MNRRKTVGGVLAAIALTTLVGCSSNGSGNNSSSPSSSAAASSSSSASNGSGAQQGAIDQLLKNSPIQFAPQSANLSDKSSATLKTVAENLAKSPDTKVKVTGFVGKGSGLSADKLKELSKKRAEAVASALEKDGVKKDNVQTEVGEAGKGQSAEITVAS